MKKYKPILFILSPVIIGEIFNRLILTPVLGTVLILASPFALLVYWLLAGRKFAEYNRNPLGAIILGNSLGFISLIIYYWQFIILNSGQRSTLLVGLSQAFSSPLAFLTANMGLWFETSDNIISLPSLNAMQVIGLILMVAVFSVGYFIGRRQMRTALINKVRGK